MQSSPPKVHNLTGLHGPCLELSNDWGRATVALTGGQLISWVPRGETEVFWLTASPAPSPTPLRGGVPVCWPWFARQGVPESYPQHGVVRTLPWTCLASEIEAKTIRVTLAPDWSKCSKVAKDMLVDLFKVRLDQLHLTQTIALSQDQLTQELVTVNASEQPVRITQALHSYFKVGDVRTIRVDGLQGKDYLDKLQGFARFHQSVPFQFDTACDRIYLDTQGHFKLDDPVFRRTLMLQTAYSESVVAWNPGSLDAFNMIDVGNAQWSDFFCLEASQAEPKGITVAPGATCRLKQTLTCQSWTHPLPP